ncbi:phage tail protein [Pseudoalteromonas sp. NZS127]|uniref:phage tail-collar fiber domain-containing protein n=1 Tax=Pseudoalteromonas sp. NZS127 TaxID=2792047 RepID=UPI0018CF8486|nr:phage tail protein [Pseudoalteromonas sp. NZS127]MBH0073772.1 phage tail protein [Pseudoalteromonas sp. NZS127]
MAQVITLAGEKLFATKAQANQQLDIDTFIFANVAGQDPAAAIDRNEGIPTSAIVHQQNVQQTGRINDNVVVYSTVLDSVTGPFEFNWVGLYSSVNQTLVAISHVPTVSKTITAPGSAGNTLNRNFGIEYSGIADLAGISVSPETWQLDFSARLNGMDELTRQLASDMNGKDWFIDDGFKVVPRSTANTFSVTPGVGYVSGLRVELKQEHILTLQTYPQFVYVDAYFDGNASSQWKPQVDFTVTSSEMDDYIDVNGVQHYVYKIAVISAADAAVDMRDSITEKQNSYTRNFKTVIAAKKDKHLREGQRINIEERANAAFNVVIGSDGDGYKAINSDVSALKFELDISDEVDIKAFGAKGNRVTNDNPAFDSALNSDADRIRFSRGIYQANLSNGKSNRTFTFDEGFILDGVAHIATGIGTDFQGGPIVPVVNVKTIGVLAATIRVGSYYCNKLSLDKIRITEVDAKYVNQTAQGGSTGVHLYFGTHNVTIDEIVLDSVAQSYGLGIDSYLTKDAAHYPTNIRIKRLVIAKGDIRAAAIVTSQTRNLKIDEIIIEGQAVDQVAWISNDDKDLKVGTLEHDGIGAGSGQQAIYFNNIEDDSSVEFGSLTVKNVPGIAFRTYGKGTVKVTHFKAKNNREGARIQSKVTMIDTDVADNLEVGLYIKEGAQGSYFAKTEAEGSVGSGIIVECPDIFMPHIKTKGFAGLYGLSLLSTAVNFNNDYIDGSFCDQAIRCISPGPVNMGVMNLHDNTNGFIGSGMDIFSYKYANYKNNTVNTNVTFETLAGFKGGLYVAPVE